MSAVAKKVPVPGRETGTSLPPRASPSAATPAAAGAAGVRRTGSSRIGSSVSTRQAMAQGCESVEDEARAETVALLDDLKARLSKAESDLQTNKRQRDVLQSRLDDAVKEQAKLEESVHENEEQIEVLTNEKREAARQMREMETIYEAERSAMMREKEAMGSQEEEMQAIIQRLKDSLAQRSDDDRPRQCTGSSPKVESGSFAPPLTLQHTDSRNNSKLVLQKDKLIESLRLELAEAQIKLVESENQGGGRLQEVERLLMEARMANARLMEDNESYQLLLQEKTLKGDFGNGDFSYMTSAANQDALAALEGRAGNSLADELKEAGEADETVKRLEAELKSAKDQNKALTLYINKIIERLLQHQDFEHILDTSIDFKAAANTNKDLPAPPAQAPSFMERAKSFVGPTAAAAAVAKRRPMSFAPFGPTSAMHSNPETAPSIPIGMPRSASTRRGRPMSEQFTGGPGASIARTMYRTSDGPLSPPLRSNIAGNRASSGSAVLTSGGNFPGMRSDTSSTSGASDADGLSTPPSQGSPPRPHHPEKATTFAGNKPRPLRLLQENTDAVAAKRQSWFGWAGSAFGKKEDISPSAETMRK